MIVFTPRVALSIGVGLTSLSTLTEARNAHQTFAVSVLIIAILRQFLLRVKICCLTL